MKLHPRIATLGALAATLITTAGLAPPATAAPTHPTAVATHTALVNNWYAGFLFRGQVDPASGYWVAQLDAGTPHADVLRSITRTEEYAELHVFEIYAAHFGRGRDASAQVWVDGIQEGMAPEWVEQNVLASAEFITLVGGTRVDRWYETILGRYVADPASTGEEAHWNAVAARDGALAAVRGIWYSPEAVDLRTTRVIENQLGRPITAPERAYFAPRVARSLIETQIEVATTGEYERLALTRDPAPIPTGQP